VGKEVADTFLKHSYTGNTWDKNSSYQKLIRL
jgi:hypothetical protein